MSVHVSSAVWKQTTAKGSQLLVLLALADIADDEGRCYPGIKSLAAKTRLSPRAVQYNIAALTASGELRIDAPRGSQYGTNLYVVTPGGHPETTGDAKIASRNPLRVSDATFVEDTQPAARLDTQPTACNTSVDTLDLETSVTRQLRTRAKRGPQPLTDEQRQRIIEDHPHIPDVSAEIDAALNHTASTKALNMNLYVRTWLRRWRDPRTLINVPVKANRWANVMVAAGSENARAPEYYEFGDEAE